MNTTVLDEEHSVCETCLSGERTLSRLGGLRAVYVALTDSDARADPRVCWECAAALRSAARFRLRAAHAQARLSTGGSEPPDLKSASSLRSTACLVIQIIPELNIFSIESFCEPLLDVVKVEYESEGNAELINVDPFPNSDSDFKDNLNDRNVISASGKIGPKRSQTRFRSARPWKQTELYESEDKKPEPASEISAESDSKPFHKIDRHTQPQTFKTKASQKSNLKKTLNKIRGRPRSRIGLVKLNEAEAKKYRKQEREQEGFRTAKYKCDTCILVLCKTNYTPHMRTAHGLESYKYSCDICQVRLRTKTLLTRHIEEHYKLYNCFRCNFKSISKSRMRYHYVRTHTLRKYHFCWACSSRFAEWADLREHLKDHRTQDKKFECDKCGVTVRTRLKMEKHLANHDNYECSACSFVSKKKYNIRIHYQRKHAVAPVLSEVYCVECNKQYHTNLAYESHLATVHCPKPEVIVPCTACDKTFSDSRRLKSHYEFMHLKKTNFYCEMCKKYFYSKSGLRGHTKRVHEGVPIPKNQICNICGRGFSTKRILVHHVRTHTGERPHRCDYCSAAFAQKIAMKSHIKNVHLRAAQN